MATGVKVPELIRSLEAQSESLCTPLGRDPGSGLLHWRRWRAAADAPVVPDLPLVMLHGGSGSWTHWLRSIEPLRKAGYTLYLPDLPGFGDSDAVAGGVDVDSMIDPLALGMQQLLGIGVDGPLCDLVGFSFGGMAAGLLAAQYPKLVRHLVLVGAPGMGVTEGRSVRLKGWRHLPTPEAQREAHRDNLAALMLHDAGLIDEDTLALHALNVTRDRLPRRRLSQTDILAQALARVQAPVSAIYGAYDPLYLGRLDVLQALLLRLARGRLRWQQIENAGHWVQHERPEQFHAALLSALGAETPSL